MTCSQLLHLQNTLDYNDMRHLGIITAFADNGFPVEKWEKDGSLEANVRWAEREYYENYGRGGHRGLPDIDDFLYCVSDVLYNDNLDPEYPMNVDMDKVYDLLEIID